jgi:hypothetical protein
MSHLALKSGYTEMVERLNRFPQGAPPSDTLHKILRLLLSEQEAALVALMPIKPFTALKASQIWKMDLAEAQKVLEGLASRAMLVDVFIHGEMTYTLPPPMAGFFEFAMMRTRGDIDQKLLSELLHQYLNVEETSCARCWAGAKLSSGGPSSTSPCSRTRTPCTCWTTSAPPR